MTDLKVQIGDDTVPLKDCAWVQSAPCGCLVALTMAVSGDEVHATAEQAHKRLSPRKRDRDKGNREGYTFRLITMAYYRAEIGARWECPAHQREAVS